MKQLDIPYYLELQRRLIEIFNYVSCHEDNFNVYSIKIENLFVDCCAFFDSLSQAYIKDLSSNSHVFHKQNEVDNFDKKVNNQYFFNFGDYRELIFNEFALYDFSVNVNTYENGFIGNPLENTSSSINNYLIFPFEELKQQSNSKIFWWKDFTTLKHNRLENIKKATLKNTIYSLAGTFIILSLRNQKRFKNGSIPRELYDLFYPKYWERSGRKIAGIYTFK